MAAAQGRTAARLSEVQEPELGSPEAGGILMPSRRKKAAGRSKDSEVHAYAWIKRNLDLLGWNTRNPERVAAGQVWTQNEVTHN